VETTSGRRGARGHPASGGRGGPARVAASLVVVLLAAACGSASGPSSAPHTPEPARRATAHSGGLSITLTVTPARAAGGRAIDVTAKAQESRAPGSLTYQVSYGDGARAQNAAPLLCQAGSSGPARATWRLSHRYAHSGTYRVSLTVHAACTPDAARTAVSISVG
jgi:PKD domain